MQDDKEKIAALEAEVANLIEVTAQLYLAIDAAANIAIDGPKVLAAAMFKSPDEPEIQATMSGHAERLDAAMAVARQKIWKNDADAT